MLQLISYNHVIKSKGSVWMKMSQQGRILDLILTKL